MEKLDMAERKLAKKYGRLAEIGARSSHFRNEDFNSIQEIIERSREAFSDYPAIREYLMMEFIESYNRDIVAQLTNLARPEKLKVFLHEEIQQFKIFVEQNKEILEKVSALVNNEFKIVEPKKCKKTMRGKQFCTSGKEQREIKTLSEIMSYINGMNSTLANEDRGEL